MLETIGVFSGNRPILEWASLCRVLLIVTVVGLAIAISIPYARIATTAALHLDVTPLHHESVDHPVEDGEIILGFIDQREETLDVLRSSILIQFDDYRSFDSCVRVAWVDIGHLHRHEWIRRFTLENFSSILEGDQESDHRRHNHHDTQRCRIAIVEELPTLPQRNRFFIHHRYEFVHASTDVLVIGIQFQCLLVILEGSLPMASSSANLDFAHGDLSFGC